MTSYTVHDVERYPNGAPRISRYCLRGQLHNEEGAAYMAYHENGVVANSTHYLHGVVHRNPANGPAVQISTPEGICWRREYRVDGKLHRDTGPAAIYQDNQGRRWYEAHYLDGRLHRSEGAPTISSFHRDGSIRRQEFIVNGLHHRTDGPAVVEYDTEGVLVWDEYWLDGKQLDVMNDTLRVASAAASGPGL